MSDACTSFAPVDPTSSLSIAPVTMSTRSPRPRRQRDKSSVASSAPSIARPDYVELSFSAGADQHDGLPLARRNTPLRQGSIKPGGSRDSDDRVCGSRISRR
ncbi:hypothetical protein OH76DRAFT_1411646 [Lentinus brumalis]|uniref:Uncharacterized protein n=1 Tax=Lentinus brumalis TaxID=2498619 RepID=A0A371CNT5_9APHY|nr:hypothetical protein OH76DRAFT_1411646 [Polyporus brumalis]